jgi:hypothetical protein
MGAIKRADADELVRRVVMLGIGRAALVLPVMGVSQHRRVHPLLLAANASP